ncbi:tRNA1(Val) (adenine(37)-N6)-methyltransferase [Desulfopila sp. IMCC35008]|uniref:tRNA1(Val) (adenine(37)-N6)-methyltransferase n=1 Tax=Desulfopila sp. IMCC35008 TaxID=2653858 RepID=UPI0013D15481|nr:methyltransferase [Desulfopila sp. IMCC35008]
MSTDNNRGIRTDDSIFDGDVICRQHKNGYRFSIDSVLVGHFLTPTNKSVIFDAGTGCGIIPLILMYRWKERIASIDALEIQPRLKQLADTNFRLNGISNKCHTIEGDISAVLQVLTPEQYDHTICNPPYYKVNSGRQSGDSEARAARHQLNGTISDFTKGCSAVLKNRGSAVFVYPAELSVELFEALAKTRLEIKRLQYVYSYPGNGEGAVLILVECIKNGGSGLKVLPPFYIYSEKNGEYSAEMKCLYQQEPK